jgi:hypothetical protein
LSNVVASLLGRSQPPRPSPFPADPRGLRRHRPPALARPGSSSPGLTSSSEFSTEPAGPPRARAEHLPRGFRPPSRHQHKESTHRQRSRAAYVPPSVFRTPSTGYSSLYLAGLFHPAATSEVSSPGVSPDGQQVGLVTRLCPLVGCRRPPAEELPLPLQLAPPRLQGLDPAIDSVVPVSRLRPAATRIPS